MTWLAHHEFGGDHRPFEWGAASGTSYAPTDLEYWLAQWIGVYGFLLEQVSEDDERRVLVCYELLYGQSPAVWSSLCERLDIPPGTEPASGFESRNSAARDIEAGRLRDEAYAIYEALMIRSSNQLLS